MIWVFILYFYEIWYIRLGIPIWSFFLQNLIFNSLKAKSLKSSFFCLYTRHVRKTVGFKLYFFDHSYTKIFCSISPQKITVSNLKYKFFQKIDLMFQIMNFGGSLEYTGEYVFIKYIYMYTILMKFCTHVPTFSRKVLVQVRPPPPSPLGLGGLKH